MNGGPGSTSMWGLWTEMGPLRAKKVGATEDDYQILPAKKSWTDKYNVIFIDQPVGVGFSWPETTKLDA